MVDKILATIGMAMFLAFVGFMALNVNKLNLWIIVAVVSVMAIIEFWQAAREATEMDISGDSAGTSDVRRSDLGGAG